MCLAGPEVDYEARAMPMVMAKSLEAWLGSDREGQLTLVGCLACLVLGTGRWVVNI